MAKYYSDDVTWCANRECDIIECERNQKNIRKTVPFSKYLSITNLEGTSLCIKEKEVP